MKQKCLLNIFCASYLIKSLWIELIDAIKVYLGSILNEKSRKFVEKAEERGRAHLKMGLLHFPQLGQPQSEAVGSARRGRAQCAEGTTVLTGPETCWLWHGPALLLNVTVSFAWVESVPASVKGQESGAFGLCWKVRQLLY